jgi:molecular chaperone GrpE
LALRRDPIAQRKGRPQVVMEQQRSLHSKRSGAGPTINARQNRESQPDGETEETPPLGLAFADLQPLLEEIARLRHDFETKVKYDESKERLIESLHRELQAHREGLTFHILRPLFLDLIGLYDEFDTFLGQSGQNHEPMRMFQETIEDILYRQSVEVFTVETETFLPSQQRTIRTIPTPEKTLDKQIARRVRKGFLYEGHVLRPEMVEIYKYVPNT